LSDDIHNAVLFARSIFVHKGSLRWSSKTVTTYKNNCRERVLSLQQHKNIGNSCSRQR